jgi:dihydrofolate reductase
MVDQAREAAGDRDVRIAGGGATILQYLNAGLIDEFSVDARRTYVNPGQHGQPSRGRPGPRQTLPAWSPEPDCQLRC